MPSSADLPASLAAAVPAVLRAASHASARVILIDGRSGAGKSTLARELVSRIPESELLALDSVYPGWDGLAAGADAVVSEVLRPLSEGSPGRWRGWDWHRSLPGESHTIDPRGPLVVEGCGILTPESVALADLTVWLESPEPVRRDRALARDGESYRPHWDRWAAQEEIHLRQHDPRSLADLTFDVD